MRNTSRAAVVGLVLTVAALLTGGPAAATPTDPNEDHKITLCHRTGSVAGGNQGNGYSIITVDIASAGLVKGGHDGHEQTGNGPGPDLIPAYEAFAKVNGEWVPFSYPGLNLDYVFENGQTGAEVLAAGCQFAPPEDQETTASVEFVDPTCEIPAGIKTEFDPDEVKVSTEGTVGPGETVTVTFQPRPGYVLTGPQVNDEGNIVVTHTFGEVPEDCDPEEPTVTNTRQVRDNCDGVFARNVEITTQPNGDVTRDYSEWVKVRDLTGAEARDLGCVTPNNPGGPDKPGEPFNGPTPPAPPTLPATGGDPLVALFGALLVAAGGGLVRFATR